MKHYVYHLLNHLGIPVYVGYTNNPDRRIKEHLCQDYNEYTLISKYIETVYPDQISMELLYETNSKEDALLFEKKKIQEYYKKYTIMNASKPLGFYKSFTKKDKSCGVAGKYCGKYYGDNPCLTCLNYEIDIRRKIVSNLVKSAPNLYRAVLKEKDWGTASRQLRRKEASGIRIPQENDCVIVFSTLDPYRRNSIFKQISKEGAILELTDKENLFSNGRNRSTFGTWALAR